LAFYFSIDTVHVCTPGCEEKRNEERQPIIFCHFGCVLCVVSGSFHHCFVPSINNNNNNNTMPPKKKNAQSDDLGMMRAARFGRVKNDLSMGFVGLPNVRLYLFVSLFVSLTTICMYCSLL
jgi:hypothetical protein